MIRGTYDENFPNQKKILMIIITRNFIVKQRQEPAHIVIFCAQHHHSITTDQSHCRLNTPLLLVNKRAFLYCLQFTIFILRKTLLLHVFP